MTAEEVFIGLQGRSVKLNKPASIKELHSLESELRITLHPFFCKLFSKFNGFLSCEYDWKSQICIWGTGDVIGHSDLMVEINGERKFVIGDLLIYYDFITCSLEYDSTPIFLLHEERQIASNIHEFFGHLARGAFNFM